MTNITMRIILDTNILITSFQFKVDIFSGGHDLHILSGTIGELKRISKGKSKGKSKGAMAAKLALKLIAIKNIEILPSHGKVDEALISYGKEGYCIATQDKVLRTKLKKSNIRFAYIRQKKYLEIA